MRRCSSGCASNTATSSWTNFRTRTSRSSNCCGCWRASEATYWRWATTTRRFTGFAARRSAASRFFCNDSAEWKARNATARRKLLVSLSQNYRSTKRILRVAGEVISHNEKSPLLPPKKLTAQNSEGEKVRVVEFGRFEEEAYWVASEIERLHEAGAPWRSFAVLYRKHTHRAQLLDALRRRRIPFVIRRFSILSSTLVRDLLAWLRLIAMPGDNVACARVLAAPYWGLEPRDLVRLAERAQRSRRPLWEEVGSGRRAARKRSPRRAADRTGADDRPAAPERTEKDRDRSVRGVDRPTGARAAAVGDGPAVPRALCGVREGVGEEKRRQISCAISSNIWAISTNSDGDIAIEEELPTDAVQLMTVHGAKGLEFPHVFILRLRKTRFPVRPAPPVIRVSSRVDEGGAAERGFSDSGGAAAVLRGADARAEDADAFDDRRTAQEAFAFPRRFPDEREDPEIRHGAVGAESRGAGGGGNSIRRAGFDRTLRRCCFRASRDPRAYSRVALWAKAFHPPRPEPLQLSASAIGTYETLPDEVLIPIRRGTFAAGRTRK